MLGQDLTAPHFPGHRAAGAKIPKAAEREGLCLSVPFLCVGIRAVEVFRSVQYRCTSESKDTSVRNLRGFET